MKQRTAPSRVVLSVLIAVLTLTFVYPLYYMLINALKTRTAYYVNPFGLPGGALQWENFSTMISQFQILNLFKNTFIVSAGTVILLLAVCIFASYVFAKYKFRGRGADLPGGHRHDVHPQPGHHHPAVRAVLQDRDW